MSGTVKDDGGAAFAALGVGPSGDVYHEVGMSLRDWFASQYMAGALGGSPGGHLRSDVLAADAYAYADAMLVERSKP